MISSPVVRLRFTLFCYRFSKVENGLDKFACSKAKAEQCTAKGKYNKVDKPIDQSTLRTYQKKKLRNTLFPFVLQKVEDITLKENLKNRQTRATLVLPVQPLSFQYNPLSFQYNLCPILGIRLCTGGCEFEEICENGKMFNNLC